MERTVTNSRAVAGVSDGDREKYTKEMKAELRGAMLVVMSLVASVTYQAGLIPPDGSHDEGAGSSQYGGNGKFALPKWQEGATPSLLQLGPSPAPAVSGEAGSRGAGWSLAFATLNGFAFSCSVCNMVLLMTEFMFSSGTGTDLRVIKGYMIVSLLALAGAYCAGSCSGLDCTWNYGMWLPSYLLITIIITLIVHKWTKHKKKTALETSETAATSQTAGTSETAAEGGEPDIELQSVQPHSNIPQDLTPSK